MGEHADNHNALEPVQAGGTAKSDAAADAAQPSATGAGESDNAVQPTEVQLPRVKETLPVRSAPAVEHDGWRTGEAGEDADDDALFKRSRRTFRIPPALKVAAVIALASGFGALAGSLAASRATMQGPAPVQAVDDGALKATVAQLQKDMTGLRTSLENSAKALQTQTTRLTDRLDRSEKAQAEPNQKLAKLGEAIERLERRAAQTAAAPAVPPAVAPAPAVQGAAAPSAPVRTSAAAPTPQPTQVAAADTTGALGEARRPELQPISGWVVRDVRHGSALIEGRLGLVEIEPGDTLPGIGRIENFRKQDGRWVVVTTRGLIVQR